MSAKNRYSYNVSQQVLSEIVASRAMPTTMIITFVVNDYEDQSKMAEVMVWDKSFVEYIKVYTKDSSHANLTMHYSTPEDVQHELRA